jgi:hypothetical protein
MDRSGRNDVLLITSTPGKVENNTLFYKAGMNAYFDGPTDLSYSWICGVSTDDNCDLQAARRNADSWKVNGYEIEYCLSQLVRPHCKLQFSLAILGVVIAMNFCKCASMFWTVFWQKSPTLTTVGDALASFLDSPDTLTQGRCLTSKVDIGKGPHRWQQRGSKSPNTRPPAIAFDATIRRRWFTAASIRRWIISMGLCISALIVALSLLGTGVGSLTTNYAVQDPLKLGFGKVDSRALINGGLPTSLVGAVLSANLPQAIVSFLYLTYNGLLTSMLLSNEWSRKFSPPSRSPLC